MKKIISVMMFIFVIATCNGCVVNDIISNISAKFYNPNIWEYGDGQWICEELNLEFTDILVIKYKFEDEDAIATATVTQDRLFDGEYLEKEVTLEKVEIE